MLPFLRTVLRHGALLVGIALLATAFGGVTTNTALSAAASDACKTMNLYAEELPPGPGGDARLGYGLSPTRATIPGPLIELTEGECLKIKLTNDVSAATLQKLKTKFGGDPDLPLAVSIHVTVPVVTRDAYPAPTETSPSRSLAGSSLGPREPFLYAS